LSYPCDFAEYGRGVESDTGSEEEHYEEVPCWQWSLQFRSELDSSPAVADNCPEGSGECYYYWPEGERFPETLQDADESYPERPRNYP